MQPTPQHITSQEMAELTQLISGFFFTRGLTVNNEIMRSLDSHLADFLWQQGMVISDVDTSNTPLDTQVIDLVKLAQGENDDCPTPATTSPTSTPITVQRIHLLSDPHVDAVSDDALTHEDIEAGLADGSMLSIHDNGQCYAVLKSSQARVALLEDFQYYDDPDL